MTKRMAKALGAVLCGLVLLLLHSGAWGMTKGSPPSPRIQSTVKLDANNWEIYIDNLGRHTVPLPGSKPGGFWPKGTGRNYIFGGGLWVGSLNRTNPAKTDTQVTWGYNPNSGQAEFCPATPDGDQSKYLDPAAKVYLSTVTADVKAWPEKDANGKTIIRSLQDSWTKFGDANGIYLVSPDQPIGVEIKRITYAWPYPGYADEVFFLFWVKNVTSKLSSGPRTLTDVILGNGMDCDIGNESGTNANDLLVLENSKYQRAKGDSITRNLAMQYQTAQEKGWSIPPPYYVGFRFFQSPINNTGQTLHIISQPGIGYSQFDHDVLPDSILGMTAFQIFTIDVDPATPQQRYLELSGRYYKTPTIYNAYQTDNFGPSDKRFLQCSGPFNLAPDSVAPFVVGVMGGSDSAQVVANSDVAQDIFDKNFLAPFPPVAPNLTAVAGDHRVTLFWDNLPEITADEYYGTISDPIQKKRYRPYDMQGYRVYKARSLSDLADPTKRFLLANYERDNGFSIVKDADFKIRELPNGQKETLEVWDTLGTSNGLRYSFIDSGQVTGDSMGVVNGIPYFYGVTGYDYQYYRDTTGAIQPNNPTTLEGSATEKSVIAVPRTNPSNLSLAHLDSTNWSSHGGAYTSTLRYVPKVIHPDTVSSYTHRYRYEWLPIQKRILNGSWTGNWGPYLPSYSLKIKDLTTGLYATAQKVRSDHDSILVTVEDTIILSVDTSMVYAGKLIYQPGKAVMLNGIEFGLVDTVNYFTSTFKGMRVDFKAGSFKVAPPASYPDLPMADTANANPLFSFRARLWSFRGDSFVLTWHRQTGSKGDSLWLTVWDATNEVAVPPETLGIQDSAKVSGWCFGSTSQANRRGKLYLDSTMVNWTGRDSVPLATGKLYPGTWLTLCGKRYWFNGRPNLIPPQGRVMRWPAGVPPINDGDVWIVVQEGPRAPSEGNWLDFQPIPNQTLAGGKELLDAIKVVPNPYLVRNDWDTGPLDKHLMFTHLPKVCTIRIYTLAGDLVKIIYHDGSQNSFQSLGGASPVGWTGGAEFWNLLSYNDQRVASGVYLYHVEAPGIGTKIGKFAIIQ